MEEKIVNSEKKYSMVFVFLCERWAKLVFSNKESTWYVEEMRQWNWASLNPNFLGSFRVPCLSGANTFDTERPDKHLIRWLLNRGGGGGLGTYEKRIKSAPPLFLFPHCDASSIDREQNAAE